MKAFSYIVARDYGFAPNPFFGCCTLATCMPRIRAAASVGDWVIGTGAKTKYQLAGHLVYAMRIDEIVGFDDYWADERFVCKRPIGNGSLMQMYGDNIYHRRGKRWVQENSHHSLENGRPNRKNVDHDTQVDRVLISREFVYFGERAIRIPKRFRSFKRTGKDLCCAGRGYRVLSAEFVAAVLDWLERRGSWGLCGMPNEFSRHKQLND